MKRKDIVTKLMKEGLSEKTLANMSDKQLNMLSERLITTLDAMNKNPNIKRIADDPTKTIEVKEDQLGSEPKKTNEKDDVIKRSNAKIRQAIKDGKPYTDYTRAIKHVNGGKLPSSTETIINGKDKNLNEWVSGIVEKNYHPFTSKNEIMELIQKKITEQTDVEIVEPETSTLPESLKFDSIKGAGEAQPTTKPTTKPGTKPTTRPTPKTPFQPGIGPKHNPKAIAEEK
jgi:hypothetical protein